MLKSTNELPVYYPGDEEIYLKAADMEDGGLFCAIFNIGLDPIEKTELVCSFKASKFEKLMPNGEIKEIPFTYENGKYILDTPCNTLDPVVVFIRK